MTMLRCSILLWLVLCVAASAHGQSLGWEPMDEDVYQRFLAKESDGLKARASALPAAWDWRAYDVVTPAKDQGKCGSCWAFATTGALESHIILDFGETFDLAEQTLVSCYGPPDNTGCCGGKLSGIRFFELHAPREESCYPYNEAGFIGIYDACPPSSIAACHYHCAPICYNTTGFYTLDVADTETVKRSIFRDGPAPIGYNVYDDFRDYWNSPLGTPPWEDGVYHHESGELTGGHAVLAFGWDDETSSYFCKNSWGESGGPFGDGTFRMRTDQVLQAANFQVVQGTCADYTIRLLGARTKVNPPDAVCQEGYQTLRAFFHIGSSFLERIRGGTSYIKRTWNNGSSATIAEPIPNPNYVIWNEKTGSFIKDTCTQWDDGDEWVDLEYWLVDTEGVESEHQTLRVLKEDVDSAVQE